MDNKTTGMQPDPNFSSSRKNSVEAARLKLYFSHYNRQRRSLQTKRMLFLSRWIRHVYHVRFRFCNHVIKDLRNTHKGALGQKGLVFLNTTKKVLWMTINCFAKFVRLKGMEQKSLSSLPSSFRTMKIHVHCTSVSAHFRHVMWLKYSDWVIL